MSGRADPPTELRNPVTTDIDQLPTLDVLQLINAEDAAVPGAVATVLLDLARLVDLAVAALRAGNRVHYVGAGTSGRLAVLDVAELGPTFDLPADRFMAHCAGGDAAVLHSVENAEDDATAGAEAIREHARTGDVVIGLSASGRTPYVVGALASARGLGARTALVSANPGAEENARVDVAIAVDVGPEVIAGSTRMKAGTAQKLVLTSLSTAIMVQLGRTYSNLMVSMRTSNAKLRGRAGRILREATGAGDRVCDEALTAAGGDLRVALLTLLTGTDPQRAATVLAAAHGDVRSALAAVVARTT